MNKTVIRILVIILCGILLLGILAMPLSMLAAGIPYYGRTTLDAKEQYVYDQLLSAVADCKDTIILDESQQITAQQAGRASIAFVSDHPEYFWYLGEYTYVLTDENCVAQICPSYQLSGKSVTGDSPELLTARYVLANKVNEILSEMTAQNDYDKVLYLHDYLLQHVEYAAGTDDQTAYGALIGGKAVCAGYASAFQLLLNAAGIQCWKVEGAAANSQGQIEDHAWNAVWLDGKCCYFDPTWNDQETYISHAYFGLSLEQISLDHVAAVPLPQCGHTDLNYHTVKSGVGSGVAILTDDTAPEEIAKHFKATINAQGQDVLTCSLWYTGTDYNGWINKNLAYLGFLLNLEGEYSCDGFHLGNEYRIVFTGSINEQGLVAMPQPADADLADAFWEMLKVMGIIVGGVVVITVALTFLFKRKRNKKARCWAVHHSDQSP